MLLAASVSSIALPICSGVYGMVSRMAWAESNSRRMWASFWKILPL